MGLIAPPVRSGPLEVSAGLARSIRARRASLFKRRIGGATMSGLPNTKRLAPPLKPHDPTVRQRSWRRTSRRGRLNRGPADYESAGQSTWDDLDRSIPLPQPQLALQSLVLGAQPEGLVPPPQRHTAAPLPVPPDGPEWPRSVLSDPRVQDLVGATPWRFKSSLGHLI